MDPGQAARRSPSELPGRDLLGHEEALQAAREGLNDAAWSWVGEDGDSRSEAHGEKVDRLAADVDLHLRLSLLGFEGPEYREFQTELTRYGLDVMIGWLRTGKIFMKMKEAGFGLPAPPPAALDRDEQDQLAYETVTVALNRFHHDVLLRGRWDPAKGARLTTFFIGQCKIRFANIYRAWLEHELDRSLLVDPTDLAQSKATDPAAGPSPEWTAVARSYIRRGMRRIGDPKLHRALELIASDHTQAEIAEELDMTPKSVERMLANNRSRLRELGIA